MSASYIIDNPAAAAPRDQLIGYLREAADILEGGDDLTDDDLHRVQRGVAAASILAKRISTEADPRYRGRMEGLASNIREEYRGYRQELAERASWGLF